MIAVPAMPTVPAMATVSAVRTVVLVLGVTRVLRRLDFGHAGNYTHGGYTAEVVAALPAG